MAMKVSVEYKDKKPDFPYLAVEPAGNVWSIHEEYCICIYNTDSHPLFRRYTKSDPIYNRSKMLPVFVGTVTFSN